MKIVFRYWVPFLLWAAVVFTFSAFPSTRASQINWQDFFIKKSAHMIEYALFALLLYRALRNTLTSISPKRLLFWTLILSFLYGVSDEFHQTFTPGREPTLRDVGFDTIGAALALLTIWNITPKAPKILREWAKKLELV